jgi:hypothetical protein
MPRATMDQWDDDEYEPEDDEYVPEEKGDDTIPCPHCKQMIYDGAEQCPHCGQYISVEDAPSEPKPTWIIIGSLACLAVVIVWALFG